MTALARWHAAATQPAPVEPEPVRAAVFARWSVEQREAHITAVRTWLGLRHVETEQARQAIDAVTAVIGDNTYAIPGAKQIAAVTGPFAVGKSTAVNRWAQSLHREWIGPQACGDPAVPSWLPSPGVTAHHVPVVRINLQSAARMKDLDAQILSFLGYPTSGVARSLTERLFRAASAHAVRLIVIDDVHLLKTNWKGGREVLDHLKHLNTELGELGASLVLVGADLERGAIAADPQIAGRLSLHSIEACPVGTVREQRHWQALLAGLEEPLLRHLPGTRPGVLKVASAGLLWRRTQGFVGDLTRLINGAVDRVLRDGTLALQPKHLETAEVSRRASLAGLALEQHRRQRAKKPA